jgi:hypothetical protein
MIAQENDCDMDQGSHIGRPMTFDNLLQWFSDTPRWEPEPGSWPACLANAMNSCGRPAITRLVEVPAHGRSATWSACASRYAL